jgi:hypothetical protein
MDPFKTCASRTPRHTAPLNTALAEVYSVSCTGREKERSLHPGRPYTA